MRDFDIKISPVGTILHDDKVTGLQIRIGRHKKTWYLYYRTKTRVERRPKLGDYPLVTLTAARELATQMLLTVAAGGDPVAEWQKARDAPTMNDLFDRYVEMRRKGEKGKQLKRRAPKSIGEIERVFNVYLRPKIGRKKVADVTFDDIERFHNSRADTPYMANRCVRHLGPVFKYAIRLGLRTDNPCVGIEHYPEEKRRRYMTREEAVALATVLEKHKDEWAVPAIWLLIHTGARLREIADARWEWLDGDKLNLPDSKTGPKTIRLSAQAVEILDELKAKRLSETGRIFARSSHRLRVLWVQYREEAGIPDLRFHDLRHSFASMALGLGKTLGQIKELLGHKDISSTQRYSHLMDEFVAETMAEIGDAIAGRMKAPASS